MRHPLIGCVQKCSLAKKLKTIPQKLFNLTQHQLYPQFHDIYPVNFLNIKKYCNLRAFSQAKGQRFLSCNLFSFLSRVSYPTVFTVFSVQNYQ